MEMCSGRTWWPESTIGDIHKEGKVRWHK